MPRQAREKSISGIYHVMLRGVNKQNIFQDNEDKKKLFQVLRFYKVLCDFELIGYCFMDNHIHAIIKEKMESISLIVKRISSSYVFWFNEKYERCGHLFQERFKSEPIESDSQLLATLRYIHQNPVKAGITKDVSDFQWSSYVDYTGKTILTDTSFVLGLLSPDRQKAIELFKEYMHEQNSYRCLDYGNRVQKSNNEILALLLSHGVLDSNQFLQLEKEKRNEILVLLKSTEGVSIRQISRLTGLSKSTICRL
jgi:putative transposase